MDLEEIRDLGTMGMHDILVEAMYEVERQDKKWGEQNHPCLNNQVMKAAKEAVDSGNIPALDLSTMSRYYAMPSEKTAQNNCDFAAKIGQVTFAHIAIEELAEVLEAWDENDRREELIQLLAVLIQWVAKIDRNRGAN